MSLLLAMNPPSLLLDWSLMLLAMMPPLMAAALMHVWRSSLPRRRARAAAAFALGYFAAWMLVGLPLIALALLVQLAAGGAAFVIALLMALIWGASPWQQLALNRAHRMRRIGLFGWSAKSDCFTFGTQHGGWCVASCWAWMFVPLTAGLWHIPVMILAALIMFAERLLPPRAVRWRLPLGLPPAPRGGRRLADAHG